jgi:predicted ATPase
MRARGFAVVAEAATDVIALEQRRGVDEPWRDDGFVDKIVRLQRRRQRESPRDGQLAQVHDRSPLCTLALARYLGRPLTPLLTSEIARIDRERIFQRPVFFVRPLGFIEPTAARRISYQESLEFERIHEAVYTEHGFEIVDVPPAGIAERAALIADYITSRG